MADINTDFLMYFLEKKTETQLIGAYIRQGNSRTNGDQAQRYTNVIMSWYM